MQIDIIKALFALVACTLGFAVFGGIGSAQQTGEPFTMAIMSDPQFFNCDADACMRHAKDEKDDNPDIDKRHSTYDNHKDVHGRDFEVEPVEDRAAKFRLPVEGERRAASALTNYYHVKSLKTLADGERSFRGVIINGDLTDTMARDELTAFENYYGDGHGLVFYLGLGNHDYANFTPYLRNEIGCPIDRNHPDSPKAMNLCLKETLDYFAERIETVIPAKNFDFKRSKLKRTGSYAYFWDIGDYRFVQLNNHPLYAMDFSVVENGKRFEYEIESAMDWLDELLADSRGKKVVLSMHAPPSHLKDPPYNSESDNNRGLDDYVRFQKLLGKYQNVKAVFAGHVHYFVGEKRIIDHDDGGRQSALTQPPDEKRRHEECVPRLDARGKQIDLLPIFFSGSASFNLYLKVDFNPKEIIVHVINSDGGNVVEIDEPGICVPTESGGCQGRLTLTLKCNSAGPAAAR